jgi:hypothetical protein
MIQMIQSVSLLLIIALKSVNTAILFCTKLCDESNVALIPFFSDIYLCANHAIR